MRFREPNFTDIVAINLKTNDTEKIIEIFTFKSHMPQISLTGKKRNVVNFHKKGQKQILKT